MLTPYLPDLEPWHTADPTYSVLLLIAYDCTPPFDSEGCAGWRRVVEAAREFEVHVIVGPESYDQIERFRRMRLLPRRVHFHTPPQDAGLNVLRRLAGGDPRRPLPYRHWQRLAFDLAVELHREHNFTLVHQVNLDEFSEPGYAWRLGIPFIWGPAGGTELLPPEFFAGLSVSERIAERLRELRLRLSLRSRRVRRAASAASVLLAANSSAQRDFERCFRRPVELLPETALATIRRPETARFRSTGPLNLLWAGDLTHSNALPLLLEAVANLGHDVDYQLRVLGSGPLEAAWKSLATDMGVRKRVTFFADAGPESLAAHLEWAHLFAFTSLRNSSATQVLEALGRGVPVMCFDLHTAGDIVTPASGIKIPATHPGSAIAAMATTIRALAQDRTPLLQLSAGACDRAQNYLWRENSARMMAIYRSFAPETEAEAA